jgi:LemA protein
MGWFLLIGCGGIVLLALVVGFWLVSIYNTLARGKVAVQGAWADIDVQLKRRHDLIPNLVETVKGYAKHERDALEAVIAARARAVSAGPIEDKIAAEGGLSSALGRLMAIAEAYPDLKANQNFLQLQGELSQIENRIAGARGGYNGAAESYNAAARQFPALLVARLFGFADMPFFQVEDPAQRNAPAVRF